MSEKNSTLLQRPWQALVQPYPLVGTLFFLAISFLTLKDKVSIDSTFYLVQLSLGIILFLFLTFVFTDFPKLLAFKFRHHSFRIFFASYVLIVPYLIFSLATDTFNLIGFGKLFLYITIPTAIIAFKGNFKSKNLLIFSTILLIWLPFDFRWLSGIWEWPKGEGAYVLNTLIAVVLAILLFRTALRQQDMGIRLRSKLSDVPIIFLYSAVFLAIALPIGFATDFVRFNPVSDLQKILITPIGIFFFVALPEEILFRGIMQNFFTRLTTNKYLPLIVASVLFGISHLNNKPLWDLRYTGLATVAGLFYGFAYIRTKNLFASICIHTIVDTVWILFFMAK